MRGIAGYLVATVALALLGTVCLVAGLLEREIADAQQDVATLNYAAPEATLDRAERYFEYASHLPLIGKTGNGWLNDVRAHQAAMHYWQKDYGAIVPQQGNPVEAIAPDNIELQLVVANAAYRAGQAHATDPESRLDALHKAIDGYATVLKNAQREETAAYNYEYLLRVHQELEKRRKAEVPHDALASPLGREGTTVSEAGKMSNFKIVVPLNPKELRENGGEAGKAKPIQRKG